MRDCRRHFQQYLSRRSRRRPYLSRGGRYLIRIGGGSQMELSARNQLPGTVKSIKLGGVMAEVVIDVNGLEVVAAITRTSAEALDLKVGDQVKAVMKATEVMVAK